jgi:putative transposase
VKRSTSGKRIVDNGLMAVSVTRTLRLKVRTDDYIWLNAAAIEVNQVWNWCNATSLDAADRNRRAQARFLSAFDLCKLSAGSCEYFERLGADSIQSICCEYAGKLKAARRTALEHLRSKRLDGTERATLRKGIARLMRGKLRWRASRGAKRALGWVPFKGVTIKRTRTGVRFCGKNFRIFERERLTGIKWRDGCFAQDAVGDWWLCLPVSVEVEATDSPLREVGIDLGLRDLAVTSDGERLVGGKWTQRHAATLAQAQRRGHKQAARRIHRKIGRSRADALHKFSRSIVKRYQRIFVGDVSPSQLARTRMAKAVLDCGRPGDSSKSVKAMAA